MAKSAIEQAAEQVRGFSASGLRVPKLAVVLVGNDEASRVYVKNKQIACNKVGLSSEIIILQGNISQDELMSAIERLNLNPEVDGILVQLPLPKHLNTDEIINAISPEKDVDGFHPRNIGKLALGLDDAIIPCTPRGIFAVLDDLNMELEGKHCVVVGRSNIVGKPATLLALQRGMTVTVTHSKTKEIKSLTKMADVLIVAAGQPMMVTKDWVKSGAVVIDVGINRLFKEAGEPYIVGDVSPCVTGVASHLTPVPFGIGRMTVASLMQNTIQCYSNR